MAVLLAATILALASYAGKALPRASADHQGFLADPAAHAGKRLSLTAAPLMATGEGYFVVRDGRDLLRVKGDAGRERAGGRISVELLFNADGSLSLVRSYFHSRRPVKVVVSILAALFLAGYLAYSYRIDTKGMYLVER